MFAQKIFFRGRGTLTTFTEYFEKLLKLHCMAPQCVSSTFQLSGPFFYLVWWSLEKKKKKKMVPKNNSALDIAINKRPLQYRSATQIKRLFKIKRTLI